MPAYDLNGKVALITGAARGIGFETARQLHARGASIAIVDLDGTDAREAAERIGERTLGIGGDVTDAGAMRAAVAETVECFGGLDIVMANAGIAPPTITTTRAMPVEEWERVIDVNLMGVWHTVRAALPQISERDGQVVIVASAAAFVNGMLMSPYATSKAAVEAFGRSLRAELAPFGASASVVYFSWIDTKMVQDTFEKPGTKLLQEFSPDFLLKRTTPAAAGAAIVAGIEERAPRIFAPKWLRYVSAFRGLINPLLERRVERDSRMAAAVRKAEAVEAGSAESSAPAAPR